MEGQDEVSAREQHFHSQVRESTICFLLFAILYVVSYFIITRYKRKSDEQEDEDAIVNRISSLVMATLLSSRLFLSTFTLAVSAGAVLLLPFSIISNEILLSFPQNYYIQWLNGSLIHGLWNLASLFSNLCLFVLMPFAFFFLESEGFAGLKKGIRARILETLVMLLLLALLILGIVWVASALIDNDAASMESLYDLWEFYLPYLYSCISLMGCLLLLLCTPVGLSRMFTVMGQLLVKPTILEDLDEQIYIITLEEEALQRRLNVGMLCAGNPEVATGRQVPEEQAGQLLLGKWIQEGGDMTANPRLSSSVEYNIMELEQELENVKTLKTKLERRKKASAWERNLVYPAVMVLLLIETSISVLLVACNILCLLVDETAMPKGTRGPGIGNASLSTFGFVGAALEIILIFYLMVSSVVGFYSLRFFGNFTPKKDDTTMTKIIGNCVSILVLSSALPVMSRTLGLHKLHLPNTSRDSETAKTSVNGHQKAL
ncbi:limb region 1 protein homolog isoform X7 [Pan paniscus]|uniref:limb region 1 protein homolog isoform X7 n=1 Tax=Pan paniscus TaxID=9597 RepID=UPI000511C851|nr:limb region 1 protein homolog isoform X13 [Pan troglodytes]XP_034821237.1 limb region 1 protein homolog isoform X6 [Pan paniscus]